MYRPLAAPSLALFILTLSAAPEAWAQRANFHHYSAADGMAQSQVLAVAQDSTGYLWFGNYSGLSRYDGAEFEVWTSQDGLPSNTVIQLAASDDAHLAIAATGGSLCILDLNAPTSPQTTQESGIVLEGAGMLRCRGLGASVAILDLAFSPDGETLWAASNRGLYGLTDGRLQRFESFDGLPSSRCQALAIDDGRLWIGTDGGLARRSLGPVDGHFEVVPTFLGADIRVLAPSDDGLFVATDRGLARIEGGRILWAPIDPGTWSEPQDLAVAGSTVWVASHGGVLSWRDDHIEHFDARNGLAGDVTHSLVVDRERNIWIGTDFGATKLVPGPFLTYGMEEGAPNPIVRAVAEDATGRLWIGTRGGVAYLEEDRFTTIELPELRDPRVYSLAPAHGGLWIGTRSGLLFWRDGIETHLTTADGLPSDYASALAAIGDDLWIGTDGGLAHLRDGVVQKVEHPRLDTAYVLTLHHDTAGRLWAGLRNGGLRVLKPTADGQIVRVQSFDQATGLTDLTIWSIDEGPDGVIWAGSNGDGAFRIHRDESIENFGADAGLGDPFVWQVEADREGAVWFYTNRGLYQVDAEGIWHHFGTADGLPDLEGMATAVLEAKDGLLWFGTSRGLVRYDPGLRFDNDLPPTVRIREVRSQRLGLLESGAIIPANAGLITVRFSALSFRHEQAVRFRYRLEGSDEDWSEPISDRSLSFGGLAPGRHRLLIQAANDDGVWSEESAVVDFDIRPLFWQTWPTRILAGLLLLAFGWSIVIWRTHKLQKERLRLGELVAEHTAELEHKNRRLEEQIDQVAQAELERQHLEERLRQSEKMEAVGRLAGGVAHDFNNLLTTITGFGELLSDKLGKDHDHQGDIKEILAAARRAARLTEQLLAFGRKQVIAPKVWSLSSVVGELATMLERLVGETINLHLDLSAPNDTVRCDRGQLEQMILNLAVNARDAMPQGGRLTLHTRSEALLNPAFGHLGQEIPPGSNVVLEVIDTGTGIEPELLEHIFEPFFTTKDVGRGTGLGLATVYGVVQQNEGSIDVDSEPGRGSRFIIRLPHVEEQASQTRSSGSMPLIHIGRQKHSVLVVEDEPTVRRLICGILRKYGYAVLEASGADEAFEISKKHNEPIDLLLTDVVMPELDGRQIAERLCRERKDLRVLYVSGYPDDYLSARGFLSESTEFLNKPFTPRSLIRKVRDVLDEKPV